MALQNIIMSADKDFKPYQKVIDALRDLGFVAKLDGRRIAFRKGGVSGFINISKDGLADYRAVKRMEDAHG